MREKEGGPEGGKRERLRGREGTEGGKDEGEGSAPPRSGTRILVRDPLGNYHSAEGGVSKVLKVTRI